jgi:arabinogalactan oligomer/maltooligosaccharide transport system permease protein
MGKTLQALRYILVYTVLIIISLMVLYPILFTVSGSFSAGKSLATTSILPIPRDPTLIHYQRLFQETKYPLWFMNTLKIALANTGLSLVLTLISAYIFSRFQFKFKKVGLMSMLVLQMFPGFVGMVAIYVLLYRIGLLDSHFGLVLVYAAGQVPYNTWLLKGYFDTIPRSIDEAARVDGAGHLTTFLRIILPNTLPIVAFLGITSFTAPWLDFIFPRLILRSEDKKTLALGLFDMIRGRSNDNFTMFAAGAILVAIPFVIIFAVNQKYLVKVMSAGAVKG